MYKEVYNINADLGEGYGIEKAIMPYLNSCNIACGGHSGDLNSIKEVVALAKQYHVNIGAHPSYPDKENFGRKTMELSKDELSQSIRDQIHLLLSVVPKSDLHHIKPHGALYHRCANDKEVATILLEIMHELCPQAKVFTLPNSQIDKIAKEYGIKVWREAFLDRAYQKNGQLLPRSHGNAILKDINSMYYQFYSLVRNQKVKTIDNCLIELQSDTLCIHGDHPNAVENLKTILNFFELKKEPIE